MTSKNRSIKSAGINYNKLFFPFSFLKTAQRIDGEGGGRQQQQQHRQLCEAIIRQLNLCHRIITVSAFY